MCVPVGSYSVVNNMKLGKVLYRVVYVKEAVAAYP